MYKRKKLIPVLFYSWYCVSFWLKRIVVFVFFSWARTGWLNSFRRRQYQSTKKLVYIHAFVPSAKEDMFSLLFVCLFVCWQLCAKTSKQTRMKCSRKIGDGPVNQMVKFRWRSNAVLSQFVVSFEANVNNLQFLTLFILGFSILWLYSLSVSDVYSKH